MQLLNHSEAASHLCVITIRRIIIHKKNMEISYMKQQSSKHIWTLHMITLLSIKLSVGI